MLHSAQAGLSDESLRSCIGKLPAGFGSALRVVGRACTERHSGRFAYGFCGHGQLADESLRGCECDPPAPLPWRPGFRLPAFSEDFN
jgi:hypothetical protein